MKVTSQVEVRELAYEVLRNTCPVCKHVDEIDLEDEGMTELVTKTVTFTLPDKMLVRDQDGVAQGAIGTLEMLS